jgi:hypothetical protein
MRRPSLSQPSLESVKRWVLGPPERIPQRALTVAVLAALATAAAGAYLVATQDIQTGSSSQPYLRPILELTTSVWVWVLGLAWLLRRVLIHRDKRYARQAANVTGYEPETVRRLAYESKASDGTTRVLATTDDSYREIRDRILEALETGDDDEVKLNPAAFQDPDLTPTVDPELDSEHGLEDDERGQDDDAGDELRDPWLESWKLLKADLGATLDFDRLLWSLALPAAATVALLLIAVQLWVQPWLYPPIMAAGLLVGILNYVRVRRKTSRRLQSLREEDDMVELSDAAILVKEVSVPETRVQNAWLAGRRYAHDDRQEFADEVAHRAYELVQGAPISPSVMEKQARQLERLRPDLHGFRDAERERIMRWLLERVERAEYGLVPKPKLVEECVEHDIESRMIGPGQRSSGFDPELVRECYQELVPAALVEQDIALANGEGTLTAVRLRDDPIPPEYGEVRAQFSNQFANYARWDPLYELPDVSDRLEEEPMYVQKLGYRGETP